MFLVIRRDIKTNPDRIAILQDSQQHPELPIILLSEIGGHVLLLIQPLSLKLDIALHFSGNINSKEQLPPRTACGAAGRAWTLGSEDK